MRAIIIEEDRFAEIAELMKLEAMNMADRATTAERLGWDKNVWKAACDEVHRSMHFHFVRWAQSHGASCVKK
jgi:hypothetical protein